MKKIFTVVLFMVFSLLVGAQQNYQDVVYLKNGGIIRGMITEQVPNVSIKIETADRNVFVYKMDEIEKMTKEPTNKSNSLSGTNSGVKPGYYGNFSVGYGFGIGESTKGINSVNLDFINGFQIFPYFSVGLGTGVKIWFIKDFDEKPIMIPAFVDLRGHFLKGKVSPYIGIGIGYCWEVSPIAQGLGLMFNPTFGVSFKNGQKSRVSIGTGYSMIKIRDSGESANMWNFSFGVSF